MTGNEAMAREAGLPVGGEVRGIVTLVQESRLRLEDEQGRGYLFTAGWQAAVSLEDLTLWQREQTAVTVRYHGAPDLGAVATSVRPA